MAVGGVHYEEVRGRICEGKCGQEFEPAGGGNLFDPETRDVLEAVDLQPWLTQQRATVAAGDEGEVFGDEVTDAEVLLGFVDAGGVHQGAGEPDFLGLGSGVPAEDAVAGLHTAAQGQRQSGPLVLALSGNEQKFAAADLK